MAHFEFKVMGCFLRSKFVSNILYVIQHLLLCHIYNQFRLSLPVVSLSITHQRATPLTISAFVFNETTDKRWRETCHLSLNIAEDVEVRASLMYLKINSSLEVRKRHVPPTVHVSDSHPLSPRPSCECRIYSSKTSMAALWVSVSTHQSLPEWKNETKGGKVSGPVGNASTFPQV